MIVAISEFFTCQRIIFESYWRNSRAKCAHRSAHLSVRLTYKSPYILFFLASSNSIVPTAQLCNLVFRNVCLHRNSVR